MRTYNSSGTERQGALSVATGSIYVETVLASATLGSAASTIDLSSISGSYDELVVRLFSRSTRSATNDGVGIRFNGDSTLSNYKNELLTADGALGNVNSDDNQFGTCPGSTSTAGLFGWGEVRIPQYAGSQRKLAFAYTGRRQSDASTVDVNLCTVTWENTAAITQVTLYSTTGNNFDTGTYYQIVGRKATTVVTAVS